MVNQRYSLALNCKLQWKNINGSECWTMTSNKYITEALKTLKITLKEQNKQLPSRALTPLSYKYFFVHFLCNYKF